MQWFADDQWLQFDIGPPTLVTGLVTKGRGDGGKKHWVTKYKVSYSNDSRLWHFYKDEQQQEIKVRLLRVSPRRLKYLQDCRIMNLLQPLRDMFDVTQNCVRRSTSWHRLALRPFGPSMPAKWSYYEPCWTDVLLTLFSSWNRKFLVLTDVEEVVLCIYFASNSGVPRKRRPWCRALPVLPVAIRRSLRSYTSGCLVPSHQYESRSSWVSIHRYVADACARWKNKHFIYIIYFIAKFFVH